MQVREKMITGESAEETTQMFAKEVVILGNLGREKLRFWPGAVGMRT